MATSCQCNEFGRLRPECDRSACGAKEHKCSCSCFGPSGCRSTKIHECSCWYFGTETCVSTTGHDCSCIPRGPAVCKCTRTTFAHKCIDHRCICDLRGPAGCRFVYADQHKCSCWNFDPKQCIATPHHACICKHKPAETCRSPMFHP